MTKEQLLNQFRYAVISRLPVFQAYAFWRNATVDPWLTAERLPAKAKIPDALGIEDLCFSIEIGAFLCRSFAVRVSTMISFPEKWVCVGYCRIIPIRFRFCPGNPVERFSIQFG